jgi:hypothetical protein
MSNIIKRVQMGQIKILTLYKYSRDVDEFLEKKTLKPERSVIKTSSIFKY